MRSILSISMITLLFVSCSPAQIQQVLEGTLNQPLTNQDVGNGLKQALEFGISEGSDRLSSVDGYYKSALYKILLPEEARKVVDKLQFVPGFTDVENIAIEKINRAAEDAAKKAKPIFVSAIKKMTFQDAMNILMGEKNAATQYLHTSTYDPLYSEFKPVIVNSLNKFGALDYWADAVTAYNKIPFVKKLNPQLDGYVTERALYALFDMVETEELAIRKDVNKRTTDLLRRVFAKQDN